MGRRLACHRRPRRLAARRRSASRSSSPPRWRSTTATRCAPFLVPLRRRSGGRPRACAASPPARGPLRAHDGFLAVALVWLAAAVLAAVPYMIEGGDVSSPVDAFFESMAGVTATGASNMVDIESHGRAILLLAQPHPVARRPGHHRARARGAAAAGRRRTPADDPRGAGPAVRQARAAHARHRQALLAPLRVLHGARDRWCCGCSGCSTWRPGMDLFNAVMPRASRRSRPAASRPTRAPSSRSGPGRSGRSSSS